MTEADPAALAGSPFLERLGKRLIGTFLEEGANDVLVSHQDQIAGTRRQTVEIR
jgi:hypothetical protein